VTESTAPRASLRFSLTVTRGLRESGAIALAVLALVVCVALLSFDPRDAAFSTTEDHSGQIHNRVGPVGAWLANALYFLFGRPAYLLPAMFGVAAWRLAPLYTTPFSRQSRSWYRVARLASLPRQPCGRQISPDQLDLPHCFRYGQRLSASLLRQCPHAYDRQR
jgi:DNA segregation ATPase FtsK/SpoIIIE-like protein